MSVDPDLTLARIHIEQLEISARVGITETERATPQRLLANITIWVDGLHDLQDDLNRTVDYAAISDVAKKFAHKRSCKLVETLTDELAGHLLENFPIQKLTVELRKFALPDAQYVAVTLSRSAADG